MKRRTATLVWATSALIAACLPGTPATADPPVAPPAAAPLLPSVVEAPLRLAVTIDGKTYALDALVVRRPGDDKLPVALITHGASDANPRSATLDWLSGWAHDMAHRGWLAVAVMRRGYGNSEGELAGDAGTCAMPDVARYLDAHADDLEAALHAIARRPDADMDRVLAIGDSAGGAVVMALAARPAAHLTGVINVSGGLSHRGVTFRRDPACDPFDSDLVWNFARFGATSRLPTLWLYAENDGWFRPGLVARMQAAYVGTADAKTGADAQLVMLPPFANDGHTLFFATGGRARLLPELDRFLRAHGLPTWDEKAFAPLLANLAPNDRATVVSYLQQPSEKALAFAQNGRPYWYVGLRDVGQARSSALAFCKRQTGAECRIAAENFGPTPATTPAAVTQAAAAPAPPPP